ncbi:MAG TPA: hypothetical protein VK400_07205 [Pyrinomonadaceae bacterium]|nr:hypothetical protein [Pyrinomonadaceae bacterium]
MKSSGGVIFKKSEIGREVFFVIGCSSIIAAFAILTGMPFSASAPLIETASSPIFAFKMTGLLELLDLLASSVYVPSFSANTSVLPLLFSAKSAMPGGISVKLMV